MDAVYAGELHTDLPPEEVLDRAEAFALGKGGSIKERDVTSVSFERRPPFSPGEIALVAVGAFFTFGAALLYLVFRLWFTQEARLIARSAGDGKTRILVDGKTEGYREELSSWARENLA